MGLIEAVMALFTSWLYKQAAWSKREVPVVHSSKHLDVTT